MSFERAKKIADAVLYEGYLLYPYRASASKNHLRFQFGVLAPRAWSEADGREQWWMSTECIAEARPVARVSGKIRFLQIQRRVVEKAEGNSFRAVESIEIDGRLFASWGEGIEREASFEFPIGTDAPERATHFGFAAAQAVEPIKKSRGAIAARIVRETIALNGVIRLACALRDRSAGQAHRESRKRDSVAGNRSGARSGVARLFHRSAYAAGGYGWKFPIAHRST